MSNAKIEGRFKVSLLGESGFGKTSLLLRQIDDDFKEGFISPLGTDFKISQNELDNANVSLELWDTSAHKRYRTAQSQYDPGYKDAHVYILAADITNPDALDSATQELNQILNKKDSLIYLVGTKSDLTSEQKIKESDIQKFVNQNGLTGYAITSAKSNTGIKELFKEIVHNLYEKYLNPNLQKPLEIKTQEDKLIVRLNKYISRVESQKKKYGGQIDFSAGFWFFAKSRAINRKINYLLAKALVNKLHRGESIEEAFSDIEKLRILVAVDNGLHELPDFVDRGMNSSELNSIIEDAEQIASRHSLG